jgi:hypothetical protein
VQVLSTTYDPDALNRFFKDRPLLVVQRLSDIAIRFLSLYIKRKVHQGHDQSKDLCELLSALGPTFVKLGQTLSTREDIIGKEMARTLSDLQMSAPPFSDNLAFDVLTSELGAPPAERFATFSEHHVAAASLGQVYKGTLRESGEEVAIKVQRPDLLGSIALDVYVLRIGLGLVRKLANINSDIRNIADEVGKGLFSELDYLTEAQQARSPPLCTVHVISVLALVQLYIAANVSNSTWYPVASECNFYDAAMIAGAIIRVRACTPAIHRRGGGCAGAFIPSCADHEVGGWREPLRFTAAMRGSTGRVRRA